MELKENERLAYGFMVRHRGKKQMIRLGDVLKDECDLIGVHPISYFQTGVICNTLNEAKATRNIIRSHGFKVSDISECAIPAY